MKRVKRDRCEKPYILIVYTVAQTPTARTKQEAVSFNAEPKHTKENKGLHPMMQPLIIGDIFTIFFEKGVDKQILNML